MTTSFADVVKERGRQLIGQYLTRYNYFENETIVFYSPIREMFVCRGTVAIVTVDAFGRPIVHKFHDSLEMSESLQEPDDIWFTPTDYEQESWCIYPMPIHEVQEHHSD